MSTTAQTPEPESPAEVLASLGAAQAQVDAGEVAKLRLAVTWASMHSAGSLPAVRSVGAVGGLERVVHLAGAGAPGVAEFSIGELAAVLGVSTEAGSDLLGDALEICHRLPRLWSAVMSGRTRVWKARQVARATKPLTAAAAAFVDAQVAWKAGGLGPAALQRVVDTALAHYDPDALERHRQRAAEKRCFDINLAGTGLDGTTEVTGVLDLADAQDLEDAVARRARLLGDLGSTDSLDVRRAVAVGELARTDLTLDLAGADAETAKRGGGAARAVVVHVHLSEAGVGEVARVERGRHVVAAGQVRDWCQAPGTTVTIKPVMDLAGAEHVEAYEVPDRMRSQVVLRDLTCVFPWCSRPSHIADLDHIEPWDVGGGTSPPNLGPLCRGHHRLKTHTGWTYRRTGPTTYEWTSPHGHTFTVHRGTTTAGHRALPE